MTEEEIEEFIVKTIHQAECMMGLKGEARFFFVRDLFNTPVVKDKLNFERPFSVSEIEKIYRKSQSHD